MPATALQIELATTREHHRAGEPIELTATYHNTGATPLALAQPRRRLQARHPRPLHVRIKHRMAGPVRRRCSLAGMAINPRGEDIQRLLDEDDGGPLVMLNLLRFFEGGRAVYEAYMRAAAPHVARVGGELVYAGLGSTTLIAGDGPVWDAVLLVRYPSRQAFLAMVGDPSYRATSELRTAALQETVLAATTPWPLAPR